MARTFKIGIIGFGIAGGALAIFLARAGHEVTIFERAPKIGLVGTGLLLQPSGQLVLQQLNLLDPIAQCSEPIYELRALHPNGATLVHLRYRDALDAFAYGVRRATLFHVLHQAALREATVKIVLDCAIVNRIEKNNCVSAIDQAGTAHGEFDFLVAADGSQSITRASLNDADAGGEYAFGALWTLGRCTRVRRRLLQIVDGTKHLLGLLPIGDDFCTLFWSLPSDQIERLRDNGFERWRAQVTKLSPLADEVFADINNFDRVIYTRYRHNIAHRQFDRRTICIGDAAHAMSPHLGQGANLALLDAECFARALAATEDFEAACRLHKLQRRAHINYYARLSRFLTPFFQSKGWLLGSGRDLALPLLNWFPPTRRIMTLSMAGIKRGLLNENLSVKNLSAFKSNEFSPSRNIRKIKNL